MNKQDSIIAVQFPQTNYYTQCYNFALEFIKTHYKFTSEDIKKAYAASGNPQPEETRVWGAVIGNLRRYELIRFDSIVKYENPIGHGKPCYKWISNDTSLNVELAEINFSYSKDLMDLLKRVQEDNFSLITAYQIITEMIDIQVMKSQLKTK